MTNHAWGLELVLLVSLLAGACGNEETGANVGAAGSTLSTTSSTSSMPTGGHGGELGGGGSAGAAGGSGGAAGGSGGPSAHVTVLVYRFDGSPAADEPVVVNDATGAIVATTQTGADGTAQAEVPAGGLVALYPTGQYESHTMQAVVDPPDGSTIHLIAWGGSPFTIPASTTFHVTATGYPAETATLEMRDCMAVTTTPVTGAVTEADVQDANCLYPSNTVLVIARDAAQSALTWGVADGVPESPGNVVPLSITVADPAFMTFSETIAPIDPNASDARAWLTGGGGAAPVYMLTMAAAPPAPTESWSSTFPDGGFGFQLEEMVTYDEGASARHAHRLQYGMPLPPSSTFDPTTLAPVYLDPVDVSDPLHPVVTWSVDPGSSGDAVKVTFGRGNVSLRYEITSAAGGPSSLRLPDVPASLPDYSPTSHPPLDWGDGRVEFVDQAGEDGWPGFYLFTDFWVGPGTALVSSEGYIP